ncbi:MAG: GDYXXLXY domain-containing protein [Phycisphaeraceae bacterium]|nr:GDYXXLXY domain-containing protein [Phycisphaeraceae bacterium]
MFKAFMAFAGGVICLAILAVMLVIYAWPLWYGQEINIRVVRPVDPRDLFRGDYVILDYQMSRLLIEDPKEVAQTAASKPVAEESPTEGTPAAALPSAGTDESAATQEAEATTTPTRPWRWQPPPAVKVKVVGEWLPAPEEKKQDYSYDHHGIDALRDRTLYVQLEEKACQVEGVDKEYVAVSVSDEPVEGAVNLKGLVRRGERGHWGEDGWVEDKAVVLTMHYGIDALYVKEGSGLDIESRLRAGRDVYAVIAVSASGTARLKDLIVEGKRVLAK